MEVDTHTLLLDAALFGLPTLTCSGAQSENAAPPSDQPTTTDWERAGASAEAVESLEPAWTAD